MVVVKGRVATGSKEGAYFVSLYKDKLRESIGFSPFPGTLNIECSSPPVMPNRSHFISSFTREGKEFGAVWCYPCILLNTNGAVVAPENSHYGKNTLEILSPVCLRTKFRLKDGDYIDIEIQEAE